MIYFKDTPSKIIKYEITINKENLIIIRDYMLNDSSMIEYLNYLINLINELLNDNCSQINLLEKPKDDEITLSIKIDSNINKIKNTKEELDNLSLDNKYYAFIKEKLEIDLINMIQICQNDLEEMKRNKKALFYAKEIYQNIKFTKIDSISKEHLNDSNNLLNKKRTI